MKVSFTLDDFEQQLIKFSSIVPGPGQPDLGGQLELRHSHLVIPSHWHSTALHCTDVIQSFLASVDELKVDSAGHLSRNEFHSDEST